MKLALPSRKDCGYIRRKLKIFWNANCYNKDTPEIGMKQFNRAMQRLFKFFQLPIPEISWYQTIGGMGKYLGECSHTGEIHLLTPYYHGDNFENWLDTVYHEIGHYVLWYDEETKASEFARKMMRR